MKIAIDAMGADQGSAIVMDAIRQFKKQFPAVELVVVGKQEELVPLKGLVEIIHSDEVMAMEEGALDVLRRKKSSMIMAVELASSKVCDAVVSAGSTGAFLTAATIKMKTIPNVERAALMSPFPTMIANKEVVVLDIGANNENTPEQIVGFARMGEVFSRKYFKNKEPRVYLLSNGAEPKKGSPTVKRAHEILVERQYPFFKGNMEARYLLDGTADVLVTPGFEGNILLKSFEGTAGAFKKLIKNAFKQSLFTKLGYLLSKKGFDELSTRMDYKKYGGAMLLGINGVAVKAHGSSDAYAFYNAIRVAKEMVEAEVVKDITESFANG